MSSNYLRLLLLGAPKSGKTTSAISTSPPGPVYVINSDQPGSTMPARRLRKDFEEVAAESVSELQSALQSVSKNTPNVLIWDTVTEYARKVFYTFEEKQRGDSRAAYGDLGKLIPRATDTLLRIKAHVIVLAHSVVDAGRVELDISGSSGRRLPAMFNDVWQLAIRPDGARVFTCKREHKDSVLGSRTLPDTFEIPANIDLMIQRIEKENA